MSSAGCIRDVDGSVCNAQPVVCTLLNWELVSVAKLVPVLQQRRGNERRTRPATVRTGHTFFSHLALLPSITTISASCFNDSLRTQQRSGAVPWITSGHRAHIAAPCRPHSEMSTPTSSQQARAEHSASASPVKHAATSQSSPFYAASLPSSDPFLHTERSRAREEENRSKVVQRKLASASTSRRTSSAGRADAGTSAEQSWSPQWDPSHIRPFVTPPQHRVTLRVGHSNKPVCPMKRPAIST